MYFQTHMTEIVRMVGYADVPLEEARRRFEPLLNRFGKEKVMQACEELLDVTTGSTPEIVRLKPDVRKLAFQILGPPQKTVPPARVTTATAATADDRQVFDVNQAPIKLPRYHVMRKYEENLAANKLQFSTAAELRKGMPFLEMFPALDYVVVRGQMRLYVAMRPALRGNQAAQLIACQDAVLANCAAVRIWPVEGPSGWDWQEYELFAGPLGIDPKRLRLSLDDWRTVHEHCGGDKNCGRDWTKDGCACAVCKAARAMLTTPGSKRLSKIRPDKR